MSGDEKHQQRPCACLVSWQWDKVCVAVRPGRTSVFVYGTETLIASLYWRHSLPVSNLLHWFTLSSLPLHPSFSLFLFLNHLLNSAHSEESCCPLERSSPFFSVLFLSLCVSLLEIRCSLCIHWRKHWLAQMHAMSITVDGTRLSLVMQVYRWTQTLVIFISLCLCLYISVSVFLSFFPPKHYLNLSRGPQMYAVFTCYCNHLVLCATVEIIVLKWRDTR